MFLFENNNFQIKLFIKWNVVVVIYKIIWIYSMLKFAISLINNNWRILHNYYMNNVIVYDYLHKMHAVVIFVNCWKLSCR